MQKNQEINHKKTSFYTKQKYKIVYFIYPHPNPHQSRGSKDWVTLYFRLVLHQYFMLIFFITLESIKIKKRKRIQLEL